ncbi:MAG: hypothetical protein Q9219_007277 [cf. Caloplaca sp. 3 TL-2023]
MGRRQDLSHPYSILARFNANPTPPRSTSEIAAWVDNLPTPPQPQIQCTGRTHSSNPLAPISANPQLLTYDTDRKSTVKRRATSPPPQDLVAHPKKIQSIDHSCRRSARLASLRSKAKIHASWMPDLWLISFQTSNQNKRNLPTPDQSHPQRSAMALDDDKFQAHSMTTRGRSTTTPVLPTLASGMVVPPLPPVTPARNSRSPVRPSTRSPSKKSSSPTKSAFSLTTSSGSRDITKKEQLAQMSPMITFDSISYIRDDSIPKSVLRLWMDYIAPAKDEKRIIPEEFKEMLKAEFDTPKKTKDKPSNGNYGPNLYDAQDLTAVWKSVAATFHRADKNRGNTAEPQWISDVVNRLFQTVTELSAYAKPDKRNIESLNISTVTITPTELCPTSLTDAFKPANKKIDQAFALDITKEEKHTLNARVDKYQVSCGASINQTHGWTAFKPMFANLEIKVDDRDPLIQMGAWVAAEYTKRELEGYPMDIPIPAMIIDGDEWAFHIAYSIQIPKKMRTQGGKSFEVQFVGPVKMGNTGEIQGIFKILHVLKAVVRWGLEVYEPEYFKKVLDKYKK